ncbi:hypothetical protein GCM10023205_43480 [Yinghuangia aomiensis]|uniref:Uncharacterized protein n=1 Tax=Yinghuangia aomiensis TaxID=676205 RepID=A0ABP9HK25_9ACTN
MDASTLTRTGVTIGSPAFMSPEQIAGPHAGQPGDPFSPASALVHAATGETPFGPKGDPGLPFRIGEAAPDLRGVHPLRLTRLGQRRHRRPRCAAPGGTRSPGRPPPSPKA